MVTILWICASFKVTMSLLSHDCEYQKVIDIEIWDKLDSYQWVKKDKTFPALW